jgi:hypothetical protein
MQAAFNPKALWWTFGRHNPTRWRATVPWETYMYTTDRVVLAAPTDDLLRWRAERLPSVVDRLAALCQDKTVAVYVRDYSGHLSAITNMLLDEDPPTAAESLPDHWEELVSQADHRYTRSIIRGYLLPIS